MLTLWPSSSCSARCYSTSSSPRRWSSISTASTTSSRSTSRSLPSASASPPTSTAGSSCTTACTGCRWSRWPAWCSSPYDAYPENVVLSSHWYNINNITKNTSLQLFSDWTDNFSTEIKLSHQKFDQVNGNPIDQPEVEIETAGGGSIFIGEDKIGRAHV